MIEKILSGYPKKIVLSLEKKNLILLFFFLLLSILISFTETLGLGILAIFVGFITEPEIIINKIPNTEIKNYLLDFQYKELIYLTSIIIVALFILKNFFIFIFNLFELKLRKKILITKSEKMFNQILKEDYEFFTRVTSAQIINNIQAEVNRVVNFIFSYFVILRDIIFLLILFIPLVYINYKIDFTFLIVVTIISLIFLTTIKPKIINFGEKVRKHTVLMIAAIKEVVDTIPLIKLSENYSFFINKFSNQLNLSTEFSNKKRIFQLFPKIFLELLAIISLLSISLIMISMNIDKQLMLSTLSFIALVAVRMVPVINGFNIEISNAMYNQKAFDKYFSENKIILKNKSNYKKKFFSEEIRSIEFKNVFFRFNQENDYILKDISLKIQKNNIIGIHGKSGSGKTTLLKLLMGLLEQSKGKVLINSKTINFSRDNIGNQIGYVPQDIFLIDGALSSNIALQQDKNHINNDKLREAIVLSNLTSLVKKNNDNYNLNIVDRGLNISGGQRQRIGIARALYLNPKVLILDEPNNNLDIESAGILKKNLDKLKKNKIIIVISHSKDFLDFCDVNFLVEEGKLKNL